MPWGRTGPFPLLLLQEAFIFLRLIVAISGFISLQNATVSAHGSCMHDYPYVIDIQSKRRLYHVCTTNKQIYEEWLDALKEHTHGNGSIKVCTLVISLLLP